MTTDQQQLILQAQQGDRRATEALYRTHVARAHVVARRYLGSRYDAEDVVHEAFARAFTRLHQFNGSKGNFAGWLSRIVANESVSWLRRERLRFTSDIEEPGTAFAKTQKAPAGEQLEYQDLLKALEILPSGARTVFNLAVFEGYSHAEIGEALDITPSASRAQLTRARDRLRAFLSPLKPVS